MYNKFNAKTGSMASWRGEGDSELERERNVRVWRSQSEGLGAGLEFKVQRRIRGIECVCVFITAVPITSRVLSWLLRLEFQFFTSLFENDRFRKIVSTDHRIEGGRERESLRNWS